MYELSTALSYVIPRKKTFSVSCIGLFATLGVSAIVWIILVFFSVTERFEERWSEKIQTLLGTVQIQPTKEYPLLAESSIDSLSVEASYGPRRLHDLDIRGHFVWDPALDAPFPSQEMQEEHARITSGEKKRVAHELYNNLIKKGLTVSSFETLIGQVSFAIEGQDLFPPQEDQSAISQYTYTIGRSLFFLSRDSTDLIQSLWTEKTARHYIEILASEQAKRKSSAQESAFSLYKACPFSFQATIREGLDPSRYGIPLPAGTPLRFRLSIHDEAGNKVAAILDQEQVHAELDLDTLLSICSITSVFPDASPHRSLLPLHCIPGVGYPVYLPKQFLQHGVTLFSRGRLSLPQSDDQRSGGLPLIVFGFFDTGVLPIGGKIAILSSNAITSLESRLPTSKDPLSISALALFSPPDSSLSPREILSIAHSAIEETPQGEKAFQAVSYRCFDTTQELFSQLSSEKNLFRLISLFLLMAASSNIFSMLFILVHTKSKEIAILRALGATKRSIQIIFTLSGAILGLFGATLGTVYGSITLYFLPELLHGLGALQGHEVLSSTLYGSIDRQAINGSVFALSLLFTVLTSACAGWLASMKACRINVSDALKSS